MKRVVELNPSDIERLLKLALQAELGWNRCTVKLEPHGASQDGPIYAAPYVTARAECEDP